MADIRTIWIKILAALVLVAAVAVGLVAVLANRAAAREFQVYVSQGRQARAVQLVPEFVAYYRRVGGWVGVDAWMAELASSQPLGQAQGPGLGARVSVDRLVLAGVDGWVLGDSNGSLVGERLFDAELALGVPISTEGQRIGTLLVPAEGGIYPALEAEFLDRVNRSLWWAGLIAGGVALILGLGLARQLTAPLRELTQAVEQMQASTGGHTAAPLGMTPGSVPQVRARGQDEIGKLGRAFNQMVHSLVRQQVLRRNLMADVAHELRTPLTIIRADLDAMLDGVCEPTAEALASLQEEALLLSYLVEDLRVLAQAEAGQLLLERQTTDLADLLSRIVAQLDLPAKGREQVVELQLASDPLVVYADPERVRQIVDNLLASSLHRAGSGDRVTLTARQIQSGVEVAVIDAGESIASEDLPHVFDRFSRGDGLRSERSGLELALARGLVLAHGGRIWVESRIDRGSAFRFTLPTAPCRSE